MSDDIIREFYFFLRSIIYGIGMFFLYDCIRVFRRIIKHIKVVVALEDLFFWIISAALIFKMMYEQNSGMIRGFSIVGIVLGMSLYLYFFSHYLVEGTTKIIQKVIYIISKIMYFFMKPFIWLGQRILWILLFFKKKLRRLRKFFLKPLKKCFKTVKIAVKRK